MDLEFKLEDFEGPLDLLLSLINKHQIDILDIPIVSITDQFKQIVDSWQIYQPEAVSDYLLMTAKLIKIKSEVLIAGKVDTVEEDPRRELSEQLIEYATYKKISEYLADLEENESFRKDPENLPFLNIELPAEIDPKKLESIFKSLIENYSRKEKLPEIIKPERITIKEKLQAMREQVDSKERSIKEFFLDSHDRLDIITTFLSLLELYKIGVITYQQKGEDILLKRKNG